MLPACPSSPTHHQEQSANPAPPAILLLGPATHALSGVATHLEILLGSALAERFRLAHFQVGSEGRQEGRIERMWRLLISPWQLASRILRQRIALVHINTSLNRQAFWRDLVYLLVARLCRVRVLWQVHGGSLPMVFCAENHLPPGFLRWILGLPELIVVLAQSEFTAYGDFVPGQVVSVAPNGIDCRPYLAISHRPMPKGAALRLLYLGRLDQRKGLRELIDALGQALRQGLEVNLVMAGSGPDEALLKQHVAESGLSDKVSFPGAMFGQFKRACFSAADVFVLPSWSEGLPYALLEAMAAGLPVIATRVGAIPDVMMEGVHGVFVPRQDPQALVRAMFHLAADRAVLDSMRTACRQRIVRSYSQRALVERFEPLYRELTWRPPVGLLSRS